MLTTTKEKKITNKEEIEQLQTKAAILDDLVEFIEDKYLGHLMRIVEKEPNISLKKARTMLR
ncbi:MAG: hypothetical protein UT90_C0006G0056 [Parcubacteria group bacterium GW2011_GWA1_40_21]|nr:MAG: hypothetical protein UT80_C0004G0020 [Parcubacteria group bacterium GW2011_GWC1_40_13]KKR53644.1 MAG: hypothetical protein UT90_C0006G0056 [Parcubacteria group bacterium GW2011_GWA1_40_21]